MRWCNFRNYLDLWEKDQPAFNKLDKRFTANLQWLMQKWKNKLVCRLTRGDKILLSISTGKRQRKNVLCREDYMKMKVGNTFCFPIRNKNRKSYIFKTAKFSKKYKNLDRTGLNRTG